MPYFQMSTQNPTGVRPWNFALQGLGRLRGNRLGFYAPADFPLPARTLNGLIPRLPMLSTSPYSGKPAYGDPPPVYGPLQPGFYQGLGRLRGISFTWLTDPSQSVITGLPNWEFLALVLGGMVLLKRR